VGYHKSNKVMKLKKENQVNMRSAIQSLAIASAVCLVFLGMPAPAAAQSECTSSAGTQYTDALDGGLYTFQMDEWNSSLNECVSISGVGFTITTADFSNATNGAPATYTSIYRGCHWGACTTSNPFPIEENNIASASTSVSITQPSGSQNDSAYDIWFNQTSTTTGQPNGTEVMIWINHQGAPQPFGSQVATATIDGASWNVWTGNQSSWKIISYVATAPVTSASLNLLPFFADAVSRGSLESTWWLIDVEYGFEIWTGGQGLAVNSFSVSAAAGSGGGGGTCSTAPSAPSGLTATTSSSSVINLAWTADTAPAHCTISGYNVFRSTTSGFTPSSSNEIASGVTATSYSSSGLTASTTYYYKIEAVDASGTSGASAQASAKTSASSGGGGGGSTGCVVDYTISPQNNTAFGAAISIKNGSTALTSWTLTWTFANGQTISSLWNGVETQSGSAVTVKNEPYNGTLAAGATLSGIGFNGTWNGTTNAIPTAISLNGTACTVN
jgi:predicted lipoprotein with Yx(FWY)xxD motif